MTVLYTAHATTTGGREGHSETDDKKLVLDLSPPGSNGPGTNPEQLFACGYSACFGGAVAAVARQQSLDTGPVTVNCSVSLNKDDSGFSISCVMDVTCPNLQSDQALALVQAAHQMCPYSKATRNNVNVTLSANGQTANSAAA
jgi:lipoyl-dependent peroxiredoxin